MENFVDLKSLYKHLEVNALEYDHDVEISSLFQKLRDSLHNENHTIEAEKAQWEMDFFNFVLKNGELMAQMTGTTAKGEPFEYPSLHRFDDRTYEYLIQRLKITKNPLLTARYSHLLWCSPKKHHDYSKIAVDTYLKLIKIYEEKDQQNPQGFFGLEVLNSVKNAYYISVESKYALDKVKSELRRLILDFNTDSNNSFAVRTSLVELMLKEKKKFSKNDFRGIDHLLWNMSESFIKKNNFHNAVEMLELGEKIDQRLEVKTQDWRKRIAECYESLFNIHEKSKSLNAMHFCELTLENYKKVKDDKKIRELEKKYAELRNSVELSHFSTQIDITEHIKYCREVAKNVVTHDSNEIIKFLMMDKNFLPAYSDMEKIADESKSKFPLQHLMPTIVIDQSGNPAQYFSDEDEKKYHGILQQYQITLEFDKIHLINEIIFAAIRERKLSSEIMLEFFKKNCWFGKDLLKQMPNNKKIKYSWLNLLAPSLHHYFREAELNLINSAHNPNLILAIDSLTLKIEGLFRDICRFSGLPTFFMTQDSKGRNIAREKDIHALLYEEEIKKLFDEDDLLFFRFLLVEKAGYNLRHKIAHSLMLLRDYHISFMHLLILVLVKLGKYDFVQKNATDVESIPEK